MAAPVASVSTTAADFPSSSLRRYKAGFFFLFFALATISPYKAVLLAERGFMPADISLIICTDPLATLLLCPVLAVMADKHGFQVQAMLVSVLLCTMCMTAVCSSASSAGVVGVAMVLYSLCNAPITVFYDEFVTTALGEGRRKEYGTLRVFGAYGWAIGAPVASWWYSYWGWDWLPVLWMAGMAVFSYVVFTAPPSQRRLCETHYTEVLRFIWRSRRVLWFAAAISVLGAGYAVISTFLFLYLKSDIRAPDVLLGFTIVCTVLVEIPLFRNAKVIYEHFSERTMVLSSFIGWSARVTGYSFLSPALPALVLLLEPLHGFTFGMMWLASVHVVTTAFPPELANTGFAVVNAAVFGVGPIVGNLVGGQLYGALGARSMFRLLAAVMAATGAVYAFGDWWWWGAASSPQLPSVDEKQRPPTGSMLVHDGDPTHHREGAARISSGVEHQ